MKVFSAVQRLAGAGSFFTVLFFIILPSESATPTGYKGFPYLDSIQQIPGRIRLFCFDQGKVGKTESEAILDANTNGVTWHDYNSSNKWACKLRSSTGVGLQNMGEGGDHMEPGSPGGDLTANKDCYLAETNTGDWTKYTIRVNQPGIYSMNFFEAAMYDKPTDPHIPYVAVSFLNGTDSISTGVDTMRLTSYFHSWWYMIDYRRIALDSGLQVMRFDIIGNGPMNIDYLDFSYVGPVSALMKPNPQHPINHALKIKNIAPQAGGVSVRFASFNTSPVRVECFNACGVLLSKEMFNTIRVGDNQVQVRGNLPGSQMVFLRMTQGVNSTVSKVFTTGK